MRKKIKIHGIPSHLTAERTTGVDFVRVVQPLTHLNGYKDRDVEIKTEILDFHNPINTLEVAQNYDVVYFNYLNSPWGFAEMGAMVRKFKKKMVMDIDDNLWKIRTDNPAHSVFHKGSQALSDFTAICNEVDYITCTNWYLKNAIMQNTYKRADQIKIFPNYIDLTKYNQVTEFKDTEQIQLLHYGSTTHFEDLSNLEFIKGVDKIMREYPNVTVRFVGAFLPKLKELWGRRYEVVYGHEDIYRWITDKFPTFMKEADILVVPLEENVYTRCKSDIKFIESASAKIPGVWQKMRQYTETIEDGKDGFLASTATDWYEKLKILIDNKMIRQRMGEAAYRKVVETRQMKDHVKEYAEFIKEVIDK